jgi:hypothetical protein
MEDIFVDITVGAPVDIIPLPWNMKFEADGRAEVCAATVVCVEQSFPLYAS